MTGAAAVRAFAAAAPERPWLFYPEGWDWRWLPWGEAARRLAELSRRLELTQDPPPPGGVVAFSYRPRPSAVLLDLALQEAGWLSLPVPGPADASGAAVEELRRRLRSLREETPADLLPAAWVEDPEHPLFTAETAPDLPTIRLPAPASPASGSAETWSLAPAGGPHAAAGGVVAGRPDGPPERWRLTELAVAAGRLDALLRRREGPREILVTGRCLADLGERLLVTWAVAAGAALVLAPEPPSVAGIAAWIRPTVFHGDSEEVKALAAVAGKHRPPLPARLWRRLRGEPAERPFGRLHTVFCRTGTLPAEVTAWGSRGVEIRAAVEDAAGPADAAVRH